MEFSEKLKLLGLCEEAEDAAQEAYFALKEYEDFFALRKRVEARDNFNDIDHDCAALAEKSGVWLNVLRMVLLCECIDIMQKSYSDDALFRDAAVDFAIKAEECKAVHGRYGIWPFSWYQWYYEGRRFQFGRLQFEIVKFPFNVPRYGLKKGDEVVNIHIPSGSPLGEDAVESAISRAREFFAGRADRFMCDSWLLFPPYREVFGQGSNTYKFIERFDIVNVKHQECFNDVWRVFSVEQIGDFCDLPRDTSMRRAFADYIAAGGKFGSALGIIVR